MTIGINSFGGSSLDQISNQTKPMYKKEKFGNTDTNANANANAKTIANTNAKAKTIANDNANSNDKIEILLKEQLLLMKFILLFLGFLLLSNLLCKKN